MINYFQKIIKHIKNGTFLKVIKRYTLTKIRSVNRDVYNKYKYGNKAPLYAERIWVKPEAVNNYIHGKTLIEQFNGVRSVRSMSGYVTNNKKIFQEAVSIFEIDKIKFCYEHWQQKKPWNQTGRDKYYFKNFENNFFPDGLKDKKDIESRYANLDEIFNYIKKQNRIKTRKEIYHNNFRESGGIFVHIGPKGNVYFGGGGSHRLAIAKILGIEFPAQIGVVHEDAIPILHKFRKN